METNKIVLGLLSALLLASVSNTAYSIPISINFDSAQAGYVPLPDGPNQQNLSNQFSSLGILFWDVEHNMAASVGDCGPGSEPHHLYGAIGQGDTFSGCGDTTASIDFIFVDPANSLFAAYTTQFSLNIGDSAVGLSTLTAYDIFDNVLASVANVAEYEQLGVSGVGQISRVNVTSVIDYTTWDDILFESVTAINSVPEPGTLALIGIGLAGFGFSRKVKRA